MANWAWAHTPASNWARLRLVGGPFDGEDAGFLPPDIAAPGQIVWSTWTPWGFDAWLYEWHGEEKIDHGRTQLLVYRPTGRRLAVDEIPPVLGADSQLWADGAMLLQRVADRLPPGR